MARAADAQSTKSTLELLVDFLEHAEPPANWRSLPAQSPDPAASTSTAPAPNTVAEESSCLKEFSNVKAAVARVIIAAASEDSVMVQAFVPKDAQGSTAWLVRRMVEWLEISERGDLLICATVLLANLARQGRHVYPCLRAQLTVVSRL